MLEAPSRLLHNDAVGGRNVMPVEHPTKRVVRPPDGSKLYPTEVEWSKFWKHVTKQENGCWLWKRCATRYAYFGFRGKTISAHRFAYRAWPTTEPIPDETPQLDHRCRNRSCVNPDHLDPVTNKENSLRGTGLSAVNARKTHCPRGHRYTAENTMTMKRHGSIGRGCRACRREGKRIGALKPKRGAR